MANSGSFATAFLAGGQQCRADLQLRSTCPRIHALTPRGESNVCTLSSPGDAGRPHAPSCRSRCGGRRPRLRHVIPQKPVPGFEQSRTKPRRAPNRKPKGAVFPPAPIHGVARIGFFSGKSFVRSRCRSFPFTDATRERATLCLISLPHFTSIPTPAIARALIRTATISGRCATGRQDQPDAQPRRHSKTIVRTNVHLWTKIPPSRILQPCGSFAASSTRQPRARLFLRLKRPPSRLSASPKRTLFSTGHGGLSLPTPQTPPASLLSVPKTAKRGIRTS